MKEQNYKENYISYADVVKQGRLARQLDILCVEFQQLERRMNTLFDGDLPCNWKNVKSEIFSRSISADLKYKDMLEDHFSQLENES